MANFTKDEQYTVMSLWCIFKSPLMFGGNLPDNDSFTLALLTNKNVLDVLHKSTNNMPLFNKEDRAAWIADQQGTNAKYLAVFNKLGTTLTIPIDLKELGFSSCQIIDLWSGATLGKYTGAFAPSINPHGAGLYRIVPLK